MKFSLENLLDLRQVLKELSTGLNRLDLLNNFESFEVEVDLAASEELKVRNQLKFIPSRMLITKQTGNALVTAGDTVWTKDHLYIKNHSGTDACTVKVLFMK